ncbi:21903_t:CDS:10, partial [Entrophospora sp. SA101]
MSPDLNPIGIFYPNQSVLCLVTSIDLENSRCEVSLKPSETPIKSCPYISEVDFIKSYFSDILPKKNQKKDLINQKVKIGDIIKCKIKQFSELEFGGGWVVDVMLDGNNDNDNDKTIKGIINEEQAKTRSDLKKGDEIYGMVIDYDINEDIKKLANKIATETSIEAYIELVKEDYVVISLPEYENSLAFASTKSYNYRSTPFMKFKFGQKATAQIFYLPNNKENINNDGQLIDRALAVLQLQTEESLVGGLCHISKLSDDFVKDVNKLYKIGDKVKAVVLEIDHEKQKISFGCRKSCFEEDDVPDYVESDDVEKHQIDSQESSNSEDDLSMSEKKKKKRKKKKLEIVEDLTLDLLKQRPEVNADYERLLLGSPNSSYLWINYMAHQLKLSEIEKAREIGERALKTINFREEEEKFNIWIALLNLENNFGTSVSMSEVLKRALLSCDPKELYMTLVDIYEKSDKEELTEQTYQLMRKKFSQSSKVWVKIGLYYLQHGKLEALHDLIQKCVKILPKYKHVKTLSKFAQMEFKHGEAERGRTIFEGMMNSYPKRVDLWSIYIDMEVKAGDQNIIRRLFQRVTSMKFSTKKMKFLFKKWLDYENEYGNEETEKTNRPEYYEKGTVRSECFSNLEEKIIENTEREKKENTSEKECIICTEKVIIRDFMKVAEQCDHEDNMCQNCICEYITLELLKKGNINVLCPEYGCHSVLQEPDIKRFASAEAFERCDGIRVESCATRRPLLKPWIKKFQKSLLSRKAKKTEDEQKRRSIREAKEIEKEKNKLLKAERQSEAFIQSNTKECPKCKISSDNNKTRILLITEILENILIFIPEPNNLALVCRQFYNITLTSPIFKRRWLRNWLNPKLPDAFLPKYSDLCRAVKTKTPFHILMQIIDLIKIHEKPLASSNNGSVTKLFECASQHKEDYLLIPYLIHKGLMIERYIKDLCYEDFLLTKEGSDPDKKSQIDYLSNLITPVKTSKEFKNQLANSKTFFQDTDLAFSIVLHERLDIAGLLALHPQHTLDVLEECVDRQYTKGIAWAFRHGVGELQKNNTLYLRLCIDEADVESIKTIIQSGANLNIPPPNDLLNFGSTSLLEFSIQCYLKNENHVKRRYIIELLLKSGANPNADHGRPLSLCLVHHDWELTKLLIDHGANMNCEDMISIRMANLFIKRSKKYCSELKWTKKLRRK